MNATLLMGILISAASAQQAEIRYVGPLWPESGDEVCALGQHGVRSIAQGGKAAWFYSLSCAEAGLEETPLINLVARTKDLAAGDGVEFKARASLDENFAFSTETELVQQKVTVEPKWGFSAGRKSWLFVGVRDWTGTTPAYGGVGLTVARSPSRPFTPDRERLWGREDASWGEAGVLHDGWVYVYGLARTEAGDSQRPALLARVRPGAIANRKGYEYFDGRNWSKDPKAAAPLFRDELARLSVWRNRYLGRFTALYSRHGEVVVRTAASPEGPWSEPLTVHACALTGPKDSCLGAVEHPAYAKDGGRVVYFTLQNSERRWPGGRPELYELAWDKKKTHQGPKALLFSSDAAYPASLWNALEALADDRPGWRPFWSGQFGWTAQDEEAIKAYAAIRGAYRASLGPGRDLGEKWPLIFCGSASLDESWGRASLWLADKDVDELKRIAGHFSAKLYPYWSRLERESDAAAEDLLRRRVPLKAAERLRPRSTPGRERRFLLSFAWAPTGTSIEARRFGRTVSIVVPEGKVPDHLERLVMENLEAAP